MTQFEYVATPSRPHVICINEHWTINDGLSSMNLEEYMMTAKSIRQDHIHGGLSTYVTNNIRYVIMQHLSEQLLEMQIECCSDKFKLNDRSYCLLNV